MTPADIAAVIQRHRFTFADEASLQHGIALALEAAGGTVEREVVIGSCRIDLVCDGVAIEVKVDGSTGDVARQLRRYLQLPGVDALVLVTSRMRHFGVLRELQHDPRVTVTAVVANGL